MESRTYLASDLAGELGLPRSTINDWLVRYADYLEVETRGKRKVYSEKSLRILKEISGMRNEGKSSFEIEQLLASRYGIRPELTAHPPASSGLPAAPEGGETLPAPASSAGENGETLPALRPAFEQMSVQINTEFLKLADRLEEAEHQRRRLVQRMRIIMTVLLLGLVAFVLVLAFVMYQAFSRIEQRNREAAQEATRESGAKLNEMTVILDKSREDFSANLARLREEMGRQRESFEARIREMEKDAATRTEAQIIKLKEEFARKQQQELQKLVDAHEKKLKEAQAATARSDSLRQQAESEAKNAREKLSQGERELEELRRVLKEFEAKRLEAEKARQSQQQQSPESKSESAPETVAPAQETEK